MPNDEPSEEKYIKIWCDYVEELKHLGYPLMNASKDMELYYELKQIQIRLAELINIAANEDYKLRGK